MKKHIFLFEDLQTIDPKKWKKHLSDIDKIFKTNENFKQGRKTTVFIGPFIYTRLPSGTTEVMFTYEYDEKEPRLKKCYGYIYHDTIFYNYFITDIDLNRLIIERPTIATPDFRSWYKFGKRLEKFLLKEKINNL